MLIVRASAILLSLCVAQIESRSLWSDTPADVESIVQTAFPLGNGKLGGKFRRTAQLTDKLTNIS
jgi:hypothetical protein